MIFIEQIKNKKEVRRTDRAHVSSSWVSFPRYGGSGTIYTRLKLNSSSRAYGLNEENLFGHSWFMPINEKV